MDLYCPRCGEPWEIDSLHEEAELRFGGKDAYLLQRSSDPKGAQRNYGRIFQEVSREFRRQGCVAMREFRATTEPCEMKDSGRSATMAAMAGAMYDLLGDDIDGAAAMLEDWERDAR